MKTGRTSTNVDVGLTGKDTCRWRVGTDRATCRWRARIKRSVRRMLAEHGLLTGRVRASTGVVLFETVAGDGDRINLLPVRGRRDVEVMGSSATLITLAGQTATGLRWIADNVRNEHSGSGVVVCEPRYALDIIEAMQLDGIQVYP